MNLQALKSDVQEIAHMIAGLLNLAHAEHGPPPPSETVNLARLLREQAGAIEPLLAQSSRLITVEAPEALLIQADRRAVRDMVAALLENAIQHGEGSITASLTSAKPLAVLQVYDEGAGVPPSDWEVVFDRFRKRDGASPGAGLGLAIVRQIANRAGGEAKFIAPSCVQVKLPAYSEASG
jgi:signal transduction histidine kinase